MVTHHNEMGKRNVCPKVSILWLNYNSMPIINIAKSSLDSILDLDYPNYEIIIIDGGSSDNSFNCIHKYVAKRFTENKLYRINIKFLKLKHNIGAPGSYNLGIKIIDNNSKYIVHMDNDVIIFRRSLRKLVNIMEKYNDVAAVQGLLKHYRSNYLGTAFYDELLNGWSMDQYYFVKKAKDRKLIVTQWVHGAFSIYRVSSLRKCIGVEPFIAEFFLYGDDVHPGFKLWECGYKVVIYPKIVGIHYGGLIAKKISKKHLYYHYRSETALVGITRFRYKPIKYIELIKRILVKEKKLKMYALRGFIDGIILSRYLINKYNARILVDATKIPLIRIPLSIALSSIIFGRKLRAYVEKTMNKH